MDDWCKGLLQWYHDHGCDERGVPTKATLKALELEFTFDDLERAGAWEWASSLVVLEIHDDKRDYD